MEPIVNPIASPLQQLERYLAKQLQTHAEEAEYNVKNAN